MIDPHFVILGAVLSLFGSTRYATATVRGRTSPNRVTWFLWGAAPIVGFLAQVDDGVGLSSIMTLSVGVGPLIVFASSFVNRQSYWRLSAFDIGCGCVSAVAIAVWVSLDNPAAAVVLAVLADLVAGFPTIAKAYRAPRTETPVPYLLAGLNGVITLLTLDEWRPQVWAFPVYIAVIGAGLFVLVQYRVGERVRA